VGHLAAAQARAIQRQQQRAVIEILRAGDQTLHFLRAEDHREASPPLRIRQVFFHVPPLQHAQEEEPKRGNLGHDGPDRELPLFEQIDLVTPEIVGADAVESTATASVKGFHDPEIALTGRAGVVAAHEFVVQTLQ
jgi:hypothetical protein